MILVLQLWCHLLPTRLTRAENHPKTCLIDNLSIVTDTPHNLQVVIVVDSSRPYVYNCNLIMKKDLHPTSYRPVVFQDLNDNTTYLTRSTVATDDTITLDGVEYPLVKVHISASSHPFFTGEERVLDIEGRVDKFKARAAAAEAAKEKRAAAAKKQTARAAARTEKTDKSAE